MNSEAVSVARGFIALKEGFSAVPYQDVAGIWTIGFGHVILPHEKFTTIDEDEGYEILEADMTEAIDCIDGFVDVDLTVGQEAALISFVFNVGCGAFKTSTLLRLLNSGDYAGAAKQFPRWNKSGGRVVNGLTNRRHEEKRMFEGAE